MLSFHSSADRFDRIVSVVESYCEIYLVDFLKDDTGKAYHLLGPFASERGCRFVSIMPYWLTMRWHLTRMPGIISE
jgi:hypothetical protein